MATAGAMILRRLFIDEVWKELVLYDFESPWRLLVRTGSGSCVIVGCL